MGRCQSSVGVKMRLLRKDFAGNSFFTFPKNLLVVPVMNETLTSSMQEPSTCKGAGASTAATPNYVRRTQNSLPKNNFKAVSDASTIFYDPNVTEVTVAAVEMLAL